MGIQPGVLAYKGGEAVDPALRMADFMTKNGYIDEATQKAFIKGVNGCIEHVQVLQILILNLPTNIYKSSNNKKYQQKSTNLPTI